jgi:hypothetical protein
MTTKIPESKLICPEYKLKKIDRIKLEKAIDKLNKTMTEIRKYIPNANLFFNGEGSLSCILHTAEQDPSGGLDNNEWRRSGVWSKSIGHADCGGY